jgi:hypothetical protein
MIARMVDGREMSSITKPRRLGYLLGLGIVVIVLVAGILLGVRREG